MRLRALVIAACLCVSTPLVVHAEDDWGVSSDRQQEIVRRYKQLLERNPTEGLALSKLLDYVGKGKGLDALIAEYVARVEKKPDDANLRLIVGHLLKAKAEYADALINYEEAVRLEPTRPLVWLSRGAVHLLLQHEKEATSDFEKALDLEKDKSQKQEILRKLADLAFNQRDWEAAQKYYDQLVSLDPRNEYLRLEYAQVLVRYKRYDKAVEQYDALIKLAGRDAKSKANTLRDLGDLYEQMGKDDDALKTYRDAMQLVKAGNWLEKELRQRIVGVYRRTDRLGELVADYEKKWRNPNYDQAMELGDLSDELGQEEKALKYYRLAAKKSSRNVDPRMKVIRILERGGKDKEVIAAYKDVIRIAPREHRYQFDLVRLHFRLGNRKEAESMLRQIASRFGRDVDVWVSLADTYMRFEMRADALKAYQKLVRMEPKSDAYILGLGEFYFQTGELDKATETWVKLLESDLEPAEAYAKLGQVLAEHGLVERGLKHYETAAELAPADLNVRRGLALAYENARQWQKAIDTWTYVLDNADQPFTANEARSRVINIYRKQNRLRSKMRDFQQAFEARPPNIQSGFFLAEAFVKLGEYDEAERIYTSLSALAKGEANKDSEVDALLSLEKLYTQTSDYESGIKTLQRLAELLPARAREYYHRIAELSLKTYQDDQAVQYATLAVQANPDDAIAQARLGEIYFKMGNLESAAAQYRTAVDVDPRAFDIWMKLAGILTELGQFDEAERTYRTIVSKTEDEGLILDAGRKAMNMAELDDRLEELEGEFFPLVYRTPVKSAYRKLVLELYERMTSRWVTQDRYGVDLEREEAARELAAIGQRALPVLVDALQGTDVGQRATAVRLLGDVRQGNGAVALGRMVEDPADPLRVVAALGVAQVGDDRAALPLSRVLSDSDPMIRELAIWALGGVGGDVAVKSLGETLVSGQSWREQALASISLGRIGSDKAVQRLLEFHRRLQETQHSDYLEVAVIWALGRSGNAQASVPLANALNHTSDDVAAVAAWGLGQSKSPQAIGALLDAYWGADSRVRQRAARGLVQAATPKDIMPRDRRRIDEIRRELRLVNERDRVFDVEGVIKGLAQAASVVPVPRDANIFIGANTDILAASAKKAIVVRPERVLRDLVSADARLRMGHLTGADPSAAESESLRIVAKNLLPEARAIASKKGVARTHALTFLAAAGEKADAEAVVGLLSDPDQSVREAAALAAGYVGDTSARDVLTKALKDPWYGVRANAASSLGLLYSGSKDSKIAASIEALLAEDFGSIQVAAAKALGRIGSPGSIPPLQKRLLSATIPTMTACIEAITAIGGPEAQEIVARYRKHPDPRVRDAAKLK